MRPSHALLLALITLAPPARPDTLRLLAQRDNTLYQSPTGAISNGSGERLFAGVTDAGHLRRALVRFDLSAIPAGATIREVSLDLVVSKVPLLAPSTRFDLHRVLQDWGEGASDAPLEEGTGAPSEPGDATWLHTFHPLGLWANPGGDHAPTPSASRTWSGSTGPISWSSPGMVKDVQTWLAEPGENFGWLIKADDELTPRNAKRFDSREFAADPSHRPRLTVEFDLGTLPCGEQVRCDTHPRNTADLTADTCDCAAGSVRVTMTGAPPGRFGYLLTGAGSGARVDPPGSQGELCLGGAAIGRFVLDAGVTDAAGSLSTDILNALSGGGGGAIPTLGGRFCTPPGQSWSFQYWYGGGGPGGFSKTLRVTFK